MHWSSFVILVAWATVIAGWVVGISLPSPKVIIWVDNRWKCRLFGLVTAIIFAVVAFNTALTGQPATTDFSYWPAWFLLLAGPVIYYWSRMELGRSWSSEARISEATRLVTTGPYRFVRHPIYCSKTLMAFSSAVILSNPVILVLAVLLLFSAVYQGRIEENLLCEHFPEYNDYKKRVWMLVPFLSRSENRKQSDRQEPTT